MDHPFQTNKIMPLNDKSTQATVIYPAIRNTYIQGNQIYCSLEFKDMICDAFGCFFLSSYGGEWDTKIRIQYEIEDMRNIGYNEVKLPSKIKFSNSENLEDTINYRFACKQSFPEYKIIAYKEFTLTPDENFIITYRDLQKSDDATNDEFNNIKDTIKSITSDLGINP